MRQPNRPFPVNRPTPIGGYASSGGYRGSFSSSSAGSKDRTRVNERIRGAEIRVIDAEGQQLGIMTPEAGLEFAKKAELDLVEVAPLAKPPVCRIMDYSKYKYEQEKKEKEARKKQKVIHIKEVKFHPRIETHDYDFKKKHMETFLKHGDKVKVTMVYRGRERQNTDPGKAILDRLAEELSAIAQVESAPIKDRNQLIMILAPKKA